MGADTQSSLARSLPLSLPDLPDADIAHSPYTDVHSWAALSQTLEGVGAAAYMGAARYVDSKDVLESALVSAFTTAGRAWTAC